MRNLILILGGALSAWGLFACGGRTLLDADPYAQAAGGSGAGAFGSDGAAAGFGNTAGFANKGGSDGTFAGSGPVAGAPAGGSPAGGAPPAIGGAGSGATGGSEPSHPSVCDGLGTRILTKADAFIDDFECVTNPCNGGNIASGWSTFNDLGMPGVDAADNAIKLLQVQPGFMSAHAGQYKGTGANSPKTALGFGVGAVLNLAIDPTVGTFCVDISAFDGISFWAKTEVDDSAITVNFVVPSTNAQSINATTGKQTGGDCITGCFDHPYKIVALSRTWEQYTVAFAATSGGSTKVKNVLQELGFFNSDATWDFSLDEIAFYKGTPPNPPLKP